MSLNIKHKRSSVNGAAPTPAQLEDGELAVNYNDADPALYVKDSAGAVVRIAGAGAAGDDWTRTGTELSPKTAGDDVFTSGDVKVGNTTGSPNIQLSSTGLGEFAGGVNVGSSGTNVYGSITSETTIGVRLQHGDITRASGGVFGFAFRNVGAINIANGAEYVNVSCNPSVDAIDNRIVGMAVRGGSIANAQEFKAYDASGVAANVTGNTYAYHANFPTAANTYNFYAAATAPNAFQGNVLIGGTLPSAPNITLNSNGNINALGPAAAGRVYADNATAKAGGLIDGDFYRKADGTLMVVFT